MTNYVANQSGAMTTSSVWTPNGVPGAGDTISTNGFNITGVAGILGDDAGIPITINGGSVSISGNLELRPGGTNAAIAFNGGTLTQNAQAITIAPNGNGRWGAIFNNNGGATNTWTSSGTGAKFLFSTARGATTAQLFSKGSSAGFTLNINWNYMIVNGWGNGTGLPAVPNHFIEGNDNFTWLGGRLSNCGHWSLRDGGNPGASNQDWQDVAIGWWNGTGYADDSNTLTPLRLERASAGSGVHRFLRCLFYKEVTDTRTIRLRLNTTYNPIDFSNCIFMNYDLDMSSVGNVAHNFTGSMVVQTDAIESNNTSFGVLVPFGATTPPIINDMCFLAHKDANPHNPNLDGDPSITITVSGVITDGLGSQTPTGEVGDQPICRTNVQMNNYLIIHGGGGPNPSLAANGRINGNRWTIHQGYGVILGEGGGSGTNLGTITNVLLSQPSRGNLVFSGGVTHFTQTSENINYVAFDPADMTASNIDHPVLAATEGYIDSTTGAYINNYGTNDIVVPDPQFVDATRHGLTWINTFGYPATLTGLRDGILAGYGTNNVAAEVSPEVGITTQAYRSYIYQGYAPQNAALNNTGLGGVDIGAVDYVAPGGDTTQPNVLTFTINTPNVTDTAIIVIDDFTANDNVGVTGYIITESNSQPTLGNPNWAGTAQVSYNLGSYRSATLYPWARDAAGNISPVFSTPILVSATQSGSTIFLGLGFNGSINA